jgi:hypothetical protein
MAQTYKGLIETLEEAQIKIFGGGKAGAQIRLNDIYGKAMTGDADAIGKMPAAIDTLLNESLASAHTLLEYRRDQAKSYIALENAKKVSEAMVNWEEYQATLLETQTKVLEEMRDELAEPSPDLIELQKHADLLGNIATLLQQQTAQVVQGNTYVHDQTGKIIAGNALSEKQTAQIITGNATQDVIKNLDAINTSYTAEMLTELVSGGTSQTNSLLSILSSSQTVVTLLGQLLSAFQANKQAIAQKEIEMSKAEYNAALSETSAALASLQAARAATASANEVANIEASQYMQANYMAGVASNYYAQNPTAANKADMDKYLAIADTEYSQYAAAQANLNTATAQEKAALNIYNQSLDTVAQLKQVTNALIDVYNAQYPSAPIQKFAEGGTFGGGWRVVGEKGWELEYTGPSTIVNNKEAKKLLDNTELISEVKKLNASLEKYGYYIAKYTQKSSNVLDKFDRDGLPEERAA